MKEILVFEFRRITGGKAFAVMTILGPFLLLGVSVLPGLLSRQTMENSHKGATVSLYSPDSQILPSLAQGLQSMGMGSELLDSPQAVEAAVETGRSRAGIILPKDLEDGAGFRIYSKTSTDFGTYSLLEVQVNQLVRELRIEAAGLDTGVLEAINRPLTMEVIQTGENKEVSKDFGSLILVSIGFSMLLYMTLLLYGQSIGRAVVNEKQSKTVEFMLSAVRPRQMMAGKILGIGLAAVLQYGIWMLMFLVAIQVLGGPLGITLPPGLNLDTMLYLIYFFIGGFFLYGSIYAALGAAAEDEQSMTQLAWPVLIFLMIPMVMVSAIIMNPQAPLVVFMSIFPLTSPMTMLMRLSSSTPAPWELASCLALLPLGALGMSLVASRIFRVGILMGGKKAGLGEMLRWLRES